MRSKILVVDDKALMRDSIGSTLQRAEYQVIAAGDGNTALTLVGRHRPAAVITDLKMPEMDGLELLARLRQVALVFLQNEIAPLTQHLGNLQQGSIFLRRLGMRQFGRGGARRLTEPTHILAQFGIILFV